VGEEHEQNGGGDKRNWRAGIEEDVAQPDRGHDEWTPYEHPKLAAPQRDVGPVLKVADARIDDDIEHPHAPEQQRDNLKRHADIGGEMRRKKNDAGQGHGIERRGGRSESRKPPPSDFMLALRHGCRPRELRVVQMAWSALASCGMRRSLVAMIFPVLRKSAPSMSLQSPPASRTSTAPAATSHAFKPRSQKPSTRPAAT